MAKPIATREEEVDRPASQVIRAELKQQFSDYLTQSKQMLHSLRGAIRQLGDREAFDAVLGADAVDAEKAYNAIKVVCEVLEGTAEAEMPARVARRKV